MNAPATSSSASGANAKSASRSPRRHGADYRPDLGVMISLASAVVFWALVAVVAF